MIFQCLFMNDIFLQRSSMARCWHQMWISRSLSICTRKHGISSQCISAQSLLIRSISQSRLSLRCMQVHLCFYSHRQQGHPVLNTMPWSNLCTVSQLLCHSTLNWDSFSSLTLYIFHVTILWSSGIITNLMHCIIYLLVSFLACFGLQAETSQPMKSG